ncbi:helix-turn-helix domain-containing protein [Leptospira levettii]|uniref:helix-turn-helix domain-containing protein n=1 Tax=Leptospira levettii TaxID=2023178 RepID=UPI0038F76D16
MDITKTKLSLIRKLQSKIKEEGISLRELEFITGISKSQIHKIITNEDTNCSLEHILLLCVKLNIPFEIKNYEKF